jgi:hypothetical protein
VLVRIHLLSGPLLVASVLRELTQVSRLHQRVRRAILVRIHVTLGQHFVTNAVQELTPTVIRPQVVLPVTWERITHIADNFHYLVLALFAVKVLTHLMLALLSVLLVLLVHGRRPFRHRQLQFV